MAKPQEAPQDPKQETLTTPEDPGENVFVVAPDGDVWDILRDLPGTVLCAPSNVEGITEKLSLEIERHRCGVHHDDDHWEVGRFERRHLAGQLSELLDAMTSAPSLATTSATPF